MKKIVASVGVIALTAAGAANAGEGPAAGKHPSKEESIGLVSGLAIGAAAGGPFGAIIGAALGGWVGDRMDTQKRTVVLLRDQLDDSDQTITALNARVVGAEQSVASLTRQLSDSERRVALLQAPAGGTVTPAVQRTLRGEVLFRTNDTTVSVDTSSRLIELAEVLTTMPDAIVQLDAYADPRGPKDRNLALSELRGEAVRAALIAGGLSPARISLRPHGEQDAVSARGDLDGYALERRVVISVGSAQPTVAEVID